YGRQVERLMKRYITHISKEEFLSAFRTAFQSTFTERNIKGAFRGSGMVPFNPEEVISKLDVRLRTPTPPPVHHSTWESQTPHNHQEFDCQTQLIRRSIQRH